LTPVKKLTAMPRHTFTPRFAAHTEEPPAHQGAAPAATTAAETTPAEPENEETPEPEAPAAPEETPAAPETPATAAAPKLTAFQRGALRALGTGDLVARVEKAETETLTAQAEVVRLTAENGPLATRIAELQNETPKQVAAAHQGRENEVARAVTAELGALGITPEAAPAQVGAAQAERILTRAEFDKLEHTARNQFMRDGGKITN
jgi:hypothetical protein